MRKKGTEEDKLGAQGLDGEISWNSSHDQIGQNKRDKKEQKWRKQQKRAKSFTDYKKHTLKTTNTTQDSVRQLKSVTINLCDDLPTDSKTSVYIVSVISIKKCFCFVFFLSALMYVYKKIFGYPPHTHWHTDTPLTCRWWVGVGGWSGFDG